MTHVISATYTRFGRMSPTAAVLAVLLHVATALALWWVSPLSRVTDPEPDAIDVTIERPQPPPPPPAVPQPQPEPSPLATPPGPPPAPAPQSGVQPPQKEVRPPPGLPPPTPDTAEKSKSAVPAEEAQKPQLPPQPKPEQQKPAPKPQQDQQERQQQQALAPRESLPPPAPRLEQALPPLEAPPPPLTSKDFPKLPPPPAPPHRQTHAAPPAQPHLRPSPLSNLPQRRTPPEAQPGAPTATFVNPADQFNQTQVIEQYLWHVAAKISQYRYHSNQANERGTVVLRLVISRDGRLLDVSIARSSGIVTLDRGLLEAARAAAPYAPLPSSIPGPQVAFTLPFASVYRAR